MAGYTKLFASILASSVWQESLSTKVLWITLLAMADKDGIAEASIPGLAKISGLSITETEAGLASLAAPDKYSRTKDFQGRRVQECEGGWRILNHPTYRAKMSADDRREYKRLKQQGYRAEKSTMSTMSTGGQSGHNAKAKADTKAKETATDISLPDPEEIDALDGNIAFEERRFTDLAIAAGRDNIQAVLDSLPRSPTRAPFSASRWLRTGFTGVPRTDGGLTVLRLTCDALEARQRAQGAPHISDANRETLENIKKVGDRMKAAEAGRLKELRG